MSRDAAVKEVLGHRFYRNYSIFFATPREIVELAAKEMNYDEHNREQVIEELKRRFEENGFSFDSQMNMPITTNGHPVGNLILCYLIMRNREGWIEAANSIFDSTGRVYPNTLASSRLFASFDGFSDVIGESYFDNPELRIPPIKSVRIEPEAVAYAPALEAVSACDYAVLAPGSFYASIIASALPEGIKDALRRKRIIWYANFFYDLNQTLYRIPKGEGEEIITISPEQQIEILEVLIGKRPDLIIAQDPDRFPRDPDILERYKKELGLNEIMPDYSGCGQVYRADLARLDYTQMRRGPGFVFRHDPEKVLQSFRYAIANYNL